MWFVEMKDIKQRVTLGAVQETMLIPLWARSVESRKKHKILVDHKADEVLPQIDYDFSVFRKAKASQVGCCTRSVMMDQLLEECWKAVPQAVVVEIGAGLDTRFERMQDKVRYWFDLDLPDAMSLRRKFFNETPIRKFLSHSVLCEDWVSAVKAEAQNEPVVFIAEGVLMYFEEAQVRELFALIAKHFPGSCLIFDSMGAKMVANQKHHDSLKHTDAKFKWGINDVRDVEAWSGDYKVFDSLSFLGAPRSVHRCVSLPMKLMSLMSALFKYRINRVQLGV